MAAVVRVSRPAAASLRMPSRSIAVPKVAPLRSRNQALVCKATEDESTSLDSEKIMSDLKQKWDAIENKPQFIGYSVGAVAGLWLTAAILGAVDRVPLIPKAFELVGLGYTAWFTYRYLLFKSSREELLKDVTALKDRFTGAEE